MIARAIRAIIRGCVLCALCSYEKCYDVILKRPHDADRSVWPIAVRIIIIIIATTVNRGRNDEHD